MATTPKPIRKAAKKSSLEMKKHHEGSEHILKHSHPTKQGRKKNYKKHEEFQKKAMKSAPRKRNLYTKQELAKAHTHMREHGG